MIKTSRYIHILLTLCLGLGSVLAAKASTPLITSVSQLSTNALNPNPTYRPLEYLLENNPENIFMTDTTYIKDRHNLTVTLPAGFSMADNENLVVVIRRPNRINQDAPTRRNPTGMDVYYSLDGINFYKDTVLCRIYFTYRGSGTYDLSEHLPKDSLNMRIARFTPGKTIEDVKALQFVVTMNNGKATIGNTDIRSMIMSGFQIYKAVEGEAIVAGWKDRYHQASDHNFRYYDYEFEHTQGPLHPSNRHMTGENGEPSLDAMGGWTNFVTINDSTIWTADTAYMRRHNIQMPDYTFLTSLNDSLITNPNLKLQRTATVEHVVYAIQGEPIALHPFYTLPSVAAYNENFIHWYDYSTGGQLTDSTHTELLDFLGDPSEVFRSENHGWYTSSLFQTDEKQTAADSISINTVADYIRFANTVNNGKTNMCAELLADLDFGPYIAAGNKVPSIGSTSKVWGGIFDGNNHVIRNLTMDRREENVGIFGAVGNGARIENLIIEDSEIKGNKNVGIVGVYSYGDLSITGVINRAKLSSYNTDGNIGGLIGVIEAAPIENKCNLKIKDSAFDGIINGAGNGTNDQCGLLIGWIRGHSEFTIHLENVLITTTSTGFAKKYEICRMASTDKTTLNPINSYDRYARQGLAQLGEGEINSTTFLTNHNLTGWSIGETYPVAPLTATNLGTSMVLESHPANRKYGTYATFMHPRNPFSDNGNLRGLCKDEFVVAADMSQSFSMAYNMVDSEKKIIEPTIQFRHIFRIKDGKKFADENMADSLRNRAFIRKNMRHITASANKFFQVRLDHPYPKETTTRGVFYYKIDSTDYRRICSRFFKVWRDGVLVQDKNTPEDKRIFYPTGVFDGQGSRMVEGINYYLCGGGGHFYRMMACDSANAKPGKYIVQVVGTDYDGNTIMLADSPGVELLVQEFQITFLSEPASVMVTEHEMEDDPKKYHTITNTYLQERYGEPADKIDFDEYRFLESSDSLQNHKPNLYLWEISSTDEKTGDTQKGKYFRWPQPWAQSNYGFGYNRRNDYAMQMIVNNQAIVPYRSLGIARPYNFDNNNGIGLYDRLFYDTQGTQKGYFYYVNAADDPGIIARLELADFCPGSKVHISCWMAEFSHSHESANLSFNFVARLKNGERVPLHSHISGYIEQNDNFEKSDDQLTRRNKWQYVYSSFVPILTDKDFKLDQLLHYEIELDNNAKSSQGADYAIDDIRVYIEKPIIFADQMSQVCIASHGVDIRISSDYESLMQSLGEEETSTPKEIQLFYTFLDKKKYDTEMARTGKYEAAFDSAVLRYKYDGINVSHYGTLNFFTNYESHDSIDSNVNHDPKYAFRSFDNDRRLIVFDTNPIDTLMHVGKEYIAVLITRPITEDGNVIIPGPYDFDIREKCTRQCIFDVKSSHIIKIDGAVQQQTDEIDACKNQQPVVQVDLYAQTIDDEGNPIPGKTHLVEENAVFDWFDGSMDEFTQIEENGVYLWDALSYFREEYPDATDLTDTITQKYTQPMKNLLARYITPAEDGSKRQKLYLAESSYVFPSLTLPDSVNQYDAYVLAIPIPRINENILICTQPTQVHVVVKRRAPRLNHGIRSIDYPVAIDDVPLRMSLKRVQAAQNEKTPIVLPFRTITPVTEKVTEMIRMGGGSPIYLAATNDPYQKDLYVEGKQENELSIVGEVVDLTANVNDAANGNVVLMFNPKMTFREGYQYRMRFEFMEKAPDNSTDMSQTCSGQVVFTLKIVPEYQKWTGDANLNWNNDSNWRRMASVELRADSTQIRDYVTDGSHAQRFSYAPLDFTKVVIPASAGVPELFNPTHRTLALQGLQQRWDSIPSENQRAGKATLLVQYDMVQRVPDNAGPTYCAPWQAHWCDEIHFEPGSEIGHQQYLNYNKAWVDMEVSPTRWYNLSSPLQGVVAGDMYLPSIGARQNSTYFRDIKFDTQFNNRFNPAVFQRSWNTASAIVYNLNNIPTDTTDVKVLTTWSNVYNDVRVQYTTGHGFSVKTDLTNMPAHQRPEKVLFRLPKADSSYSYYSENGDVGDATNIKRKNAHRLNPTDTTITVTAATANNKLFLVGNPFMAHLDMKKFLTENQDFIERKYWLLDGEQQGAVVMNEDDELDGTIAESQYLAPMQGFFVEAKEAGTTLSLTFKPDMAVTVNDMEDETSLPGVRSMAMAVPSNLRITAKGTGSSAVVILDENADKNYASHEDAMFVADASLEAPSLVYTVAGNTATTVNALPEITATEVGVMAVSGQTTTLLFEGIDPSMGLMLYDKVADTYTDLTEGLEVTINGSASRRLYLVTSKIQEISSDLEIILMGNAIRITSSEGPLQARVFDISGRLVTADNSGSDEVMFTLESGVYIVEAADTVSRKTKKVIIK